jgi:signal transduction histidine kinase
MRQRLLLPLAGVFLAASLLGWWAASELVGRALRLRQQALIAATAEELAAGGLPLTNELLARVGALIDARILLLDTDAGRLPAWLGRAGTPAELAEASAVDVRIGDEPHLAIVRSLPRGLSADAELLVITTSLADLESATRRAALWLAAAALASTLALVLVAHMITGGLVASLHRLDAMAKRIANGDRSVRARLTGPPELRSLAGSLNDMVARLEAYERRAAEQAQLAGLGAMAARVAHEVRNPLTAIKLQLQLLTEAPPEDQRAVAVDLVTEIRRLELLLDGLLEQGRPRALDIVAVDINAIVNEVVRLFEPQLTHRGIRVTLELSEDLPAAALDVDLAKQMLTNLLVNARDALGRSGVRGGEIAIRTAANRDGGLSLSVEDDGPGLPPTVAAALAAGDAGALGAAGGLGLRLTLELATRMGAAVAPRPGRLRGACVRVRLPAASATTPLWRESR